MKILAILLLLALPCFPRSREVAREFQRQHPCPSTGKKSGACPGYVRDHIKALCAGGRDTVSNMQWQTIMAAKLKDRTECPGRKGQR